jgi:hypothetical protein
MGAEASKALFAAAKRGNVPAAEKLLDEQKGKRKLNLDQEDASDQVRRVSRFLVVLTLCCCGVRSSNGRRWATLAITATRRSFPFLSSAAHP